LRSSFTPVDEKDFGAVMHPRRQYFQNIQDKLDDLPPELGDTMAYETLDTMIYEDSNLMGYEL